jgi:hypothetical protein
VTRRSCEACTTVLRYITTRFSLLLPNPGTELTVERRTKGLGKEGTLNILSWRARSVWMTFMASKRPDLFPLSRRGPKNSDSPRLLRWVTMFIFKMLSCHSEGHIHCGNNHNRLHVVRISRIVRRTEQSSRPLVCVVCRYTWRSLPVQLLE